MTEPEWLAATDACKMMSALIRSVGNRTLSDRKLLLFGCACCRRAREMFGDARIQQAVDVIERSADGAAVEEQLAAVGERVRALYTASLLRRYPRIRSGPEGDRAPVPEAGEEDIGRSLARNNSIRAVERLCQYHQSYNPFLRVYSVVKEISRVGKPSEYIDQPAILRDVVGPLLFRSSSVDFDSRCRAGETASSLARTIYDQRLFADVPILADALEDAGCIDAELLGHLRGPGPHVRGCWAVDLILSKGG